MMRTLACLLLSLGLGACGSSSTAQGSLGGASFSGGEAIFAVVNAADNPNSHISGSFGVVLISSVSGTCDALTQGTVFAQSAWAFSYLYNLPQSGNASFDNGSYALETAPTIETQLAQLGPRPLRLGDGKVLAFDDQCQALDASPFTLTSGVITVSGLNPTSHAQLSFTLTTNANDTVEGSMQAHYCAALAALENGTLDTLNSDMAGACLGP